VVAEELDHVPRELALLVDLRGARSHALARKRAHEIADLALLVGQHVIGHGGSLFLVPEELEDAFQRFVHLLGAALRNRIVVRSSQLADGVAQGDEPADDLLIRFGLEVHLSWKTASTLLPSGSRTNDA
jgi:hypothetical protein